LQHQGLHEPGQRYEQWQGAGMQEQASAARALAAPPPVTRRAVSFVDLAASPTRGSSSTGGSSAGAGAAPQGSWYSPSYGGSSAAVPATPATSVAAAGADGAGPGYWSTGSDAEDEEVVESSGRRAGTHCKQPGSAGGGWWPDLSAGVTGARSGYGSQPPRGDVSAPSGSGGQAVAAQVAVVTHPLHSNAGGGGGRDVLGTDLPIATAVAIDPRADVSALRRHLLSALADIATLQGALATAREDVAARDRALSAARTEARGLSAVLELLQGELEETQASLLAATAPSAGAGVGAGADSGAGAETVAEVSSGINGAAWHGAGAGVQGGAVAHSVTEGASVPQGLQAGLPSAAPGSGALAASATHHDLRMDMGAGVAAARPHLLVPPGSNDSSSGTNSGASSSSRVTDSGDADNGEGLATGGSHGLPSAGASSDAAQSGKRLGGFADGCGSAGLSGGGVAGAGTSPSRLSHDALQQQGRQEQQEQHAPTGAFFSPLALPQPARLRPASSRSPQQQPQQHPSALHASEDGGRGQLHAAQSYDCAAAATPAESQEAPQRGVRAPPFTHDSGAGVEDETTPRQLMSAPVRDAPSLRAQEGAPHVAAAGLLRAASSAAGALIRLSSESALSHAPFPAAAAEDADEDAPRTPRVPRPQPPRGAPLPQVTTDAAAYGAVATLPESPQITERHLQAWGAFFARAAEARAAEAAEAAVGGGTGPPSALWSAGAAGAGAGEAAAAWQANAAASSEPPSSTGAHPAPYCGGDANPVGASGGGYQPQENGEDDGDDSDWFGDASAAAVAAPGAACEEHAPAGFTEVEGASGAGAGGGVHNSGVPLNRQAKQVSQQVSQQASQQAFQRASQWSAAGEPDGSGATVRGASGGDDGFDAQRGSLAARDTFFVAPLRRSLLPSHADLPFPEAGEGGPSAAAARHEGGVFAGGATGGETSSIHSGPHSGRSDGLSSSSGPVFGAPSVFSSGGWAVLSPASAADSFAASAASAVSSATPASASGDESFGDGSRRFSASGGLPESAWAYSRNDSPGHGHELRPPADLADLTSGIAPDRDAEANANAAGRSIRRTEENC
jgi:hypothetical protein